MGEIPRWRNPNEDWPETIGGGTARTITVIPLLENKRPIGFARDWPKEKKKRKKGKR